MKLLSPSVLTLVAALVPAGVAHAQNDDCAGAIAIMNGLTAGTNIGATDSAVMGSCGTMGSDVWYAYTATCTGSAVVSTCTGAASTDYDTVLAVFDGTCGALVELACNDDACGVATGSEVIFPVVMGQTYFIEVGGYQGAQGTFNLEVQCGGPVNDACINALPISEGLTTGSNALASVGAQTGGCGNMTSDVWYAYTPSGSGTMIASFCSPGTSADYDTQLAVFTGACGSLVEVACNDDSCGLQSELSIPVIGGQTYYLAVGGYNGTSPTGSFTLGLRCTACSTSSTEVSRLGTPPNPDVFLPGVTSGPVTGQVWDPIIDHATFVPNALADFMIVSALPLNSDLGAPLGTLLCDPLTPFFKVVVATPGTPFSFPIPDVPAFVGVPLCAQGGSVDPVFQSFLTNALDITVGDV